MKLKKNIATNESGFIFDPATGESFSGNSMASYIINAMKAGNAEPKIKEDILAAYDVDAARLNRDWDDLMLQLRDANLIEF